MRRTWCVAGLLASAGLVTGGGTVAAQRRPDVSLAAGVNPVRVVSTAAAGTRSELTGVLVGGEGSVFFGPVGLEVGYWQGEIASTSANAPSRDLIRGRVLIGVRAVPWLVVSGGAQARSHVSPAGTDRWIFWHARLRMQQEIAGPRVLGHLELWRALAADVSAGQAFDHGQGGEVGLILRPLGALWVRLAYGIEDATFRGNARRETVEVFSVAVGVGGR